MEREKDREGERDNNRQPDKQTEKQAKIIESEREGLGFRVWV